MSRYAELAVLSNFSFLHGGSHPEELTAQAKEIGLAAIGLADRNTVAGLVRAHSIAKEKELQFLPGARLVFADGTPDILAYPNCLSGWSNLTRLLTIGKRRAEKGECELYFSDLLQRAFGMSFILIPPGKIRGGDGLRSIPSPKFRPANAGQNFAPPSRGGSGLLRALPRSTLPQGEGRKRIVVLLHQLREAADAPVRLAASKL